MLNLNCFAGCSESESERSSLHEYMKQKAVLVILDSRGLFSLGIKINVL